MIALIDQIRLSRDTIGGIVTCVIKNTPVGLGEPVFDKLHAELGERTPAEFLPETPLDSLVVRHRVGISDPLTDDEIDPTNRAEDGLPQSLAAYIESNGLRHLNIELNGDSAKDLGRLSRIAGLMHRAAPREFAFSLDGTEGFQAAAQVGQIGVRSLETKRTNVGCIATRRSRDLGQSVCHGVSPPKKS